MTAEEIAIHATCGTLEIFAIIAIIATLATFGTIVNTVMETVEEKGTCIVDPILGLECSLSDERLLKRLQRTK